MRVPTVLMGLVGVAGGTVAAVAAYHAAAAVGRPPASTPHPPVAVVGRPLPGPPPRIVVTTARCEAPARLVRGACVTRVVRTAGVDDQPSTASSSAAATPSPAVQRQAAPTPAGRRAPSPSPTAAPRPDD